MSVYTSFTTMVGIKIPKEKVQENFDYEILAESCKLQCKYTDRMSDSDIIIGKVLFDYMDDGHADESETLVEIKDYGLQLMETATKLIDFTNDYNSKTKEKDLKLEIHMNLYSFVNYS